MAVVQTATGSQVCVINTEHTLATPAGGKTYVLALDLTALVGVDVLEVRMYDKTLTTSALLALDSPTIIAGAPASGAYMSIPLPTVHGCSFTIKQTAGTARTIPWSVRSLD